jgi:hypothetical protein
MENSSDTIGNRTRSLPACSVVPQPTALLHAPVRYLQTIFKEGPGRGFWCELLHCHGGRRHTLSNNQIIKNVRVCAILTPCSKGPS